MSEEKKKVETEAAEAAAASEDAAASVEEAAQESAVNKMYIGPTIKGVARHSTTFKDGVLPEKAKKCIEEFPAMERLFVKLDELPEAVRELRKDQGVLKTIYTQVAKKFA